MIRLQQSGRALGSEVNITLVVKRESDASPVFHLLWAQINAFEQRFSRFKDASELSRLNAHAGKKFKISQPMHDLLERSQQLFRQTGGLFNPLVLPALQKAGYIGSWPAPDKYQNDLNYSKRKIAGFDQLKLSATTVELPPNSALDFGGIGKGYLLDQLAQSLDTLPVKGYWISLGGDIICKGLDHESQAWRIGLAKAAEVSTQAGYVDNKTGAIMAVATSGITKRKGDGWHHIIDPRTGKPAVTNVMTATVVAHNATLADVWAKCLVIEPNRANDVLDNNVTAYLLQISQNETVKIIKAGSIS